MVPFAGEKLKISETVLRDAQQSHVATRMRLEDMLPICETLDQVGYWSIECWGGATFDSCLRYLDEDPWDRLRQLKAKMPNTKLQMLLRGQNLLGYRHYPDDVVDLFCKKAIENGIDVVRVFDALNDVRNLETSMHSIKKYGGICEAAICYTKSPLHTEDYFLELAVKLEQMGADVICIKDMANLLLPLDAYNLVKAMKQRIHVPLHLHTHNTAGTGDMVYFMAAVAGVDIIDCALAPFSNGTSQPCTESIFETFKLTRRNPELDDGKLFEASAYFAHIAQNMEQMGLLSTKVLHTEPSTLLYQVPGGMISNLIAQLKEVNAEDKMEEVLREVPIVRKDFGYPPLVTPTSQIIGTQAVLNILSGRRYSTLTKESRMLLRGEYGKIPGDVNVKLFEQAIAEAPAIQCRPADRLPSEIECKRKELADIASSDEELLSCILFPKLEVERLNRRKREKNQVRNLNVVCDISVVESDLY